MATILAAATGNWSATGTWTGGVVPVAGDIVVANNRTITMDTLNVTVAELRNDTTGGATAGGTFSLVNGSNITANIFAGTTGNCVTWAGTAGQTATVTGNIAAGGGGQGINCTGGNLTIGGGAQVTGGTGSAGAAGINFSSSGTFTFATAGNPGTITGGTSTSQSAAGCTCSGASASVTVYATTITGPLSGSGFGSNLSGASQTINIVAANIGTSTATSAALQLAGNGSTSTINVSGNIIGGSGGNVHGVLVAQPGTHNFTVGGNISGGTGGSAQGIQNNSTATVNLTANFSNAAAGQNGNNWSVSNASTGTINITGTVTAGSVQTTASNNSTGILRCTRAKGNGFGVGSVGINNVVAVNSNASGALTYIEQLEFGSLGNTPVFGPIRLTANTTNQAIFITTTGTTKTLVDTAATSGILPAVTDVRTGVTYSSGNLTGTCAVPAAGSVALGVAVDNTTGTAVLTAANVRTAVGLASANLDTQLAAIPTTAAPTAAAIRTEMDSNSTKLANLDATVSSRLPSSSYSAPLDAAGTRSAVGLATGNLDSQLSGISSGQTTINDNVSTRLAASAYTSPPTVTQVRQEMDANSTKLANLDATVSSRLAAASYSAPPSAATNASAVRNELSTELSRIDTTISSRLTPSGTLSRVTLVDTTTSLTNAPDVPTESEIADAVRTELTPELSRISNTATTQEVSDIIEGAVQMS